VRKGQPVSGFEDFCVGLCETLADHRLENR
jgi:hypothetical protein